MEVGSFSLLQGIFSTQGSNPGLPHCGRILYQLSHQGIHPEDLKNFISQGVEGGFGLAVSTAAQGSLQMQYEQCLCLEEHTEQIRSDLPHIPDREGKDASGSKG